MRYKFKRGYQWTNNIAYAIGLITSDGCLSSDGRHIELTTKDYEQATNFVLAMGRNLPISMKSNGDGGKAYRVQFSDVAFYDFLLSIGLTPRKSLTIDKLDIPNSYYPDFLRGLFDGDGSTYGYNDPRWPSSFLFYTSFTSASYNFLVFIAFTNQSLFGLHGRSIRFGKRAYSLVYGKKDSKKIYENIYKDYNCLSLSRKRHKLEGFISRDSMLK